MEFYTAFYGSRTAFHSNEIVLVIWASYNKMPVYGSGKSLYFAAGYVMMRGWRIDPYCYL